MFEFLRMVLLNSGNIRLLWSLGNFCHIKTPLHQDSRFNARVPITLQNCSRSANWIERGPPMLSYDWPGNIRELQNFIERGVIISRGLAFEPDLEQLQRQGASHRRSGRTLDDATRNHILQTLDEANWVLGGQHGAASRLGIPRTTLIAKMRRLGIESPRV